MQPNVSNYLGRLEAERNVRVLYACESGSRAWGFPSRDSDYDVRFLYVHPPEWYLSVGQRRDVIERPITDELDLSGWELRKALRLLHQSNPPLLEWLSSPIVYREEPLFTQEFRYLTGQFYSPGRCFHHYLSMAKRNWHQYLFNRETVRTKKYLYVLRPLLACRWIEREGKRVPVRFDDLVERVLDETDIREEVSALLERKRSGEELGTEPAHPLLTEFLPREIDRLGKLELPSGQNFDTEDLDRFFRRHLNLYGHS